MQNELETNYPLLDVQILGVNLAGLEEGNSWITEGKDIPWLQDMDQDGDGESDVYHRWGAGHLDLVIVDANNEKAGVVNVGRYSLEDVNNYQALRQLLIDMAFAAQEPELEAGDANGDYRFDQLDLAQVLRAGKYETGESASWEQGDWNGDGVFDKSDVVAALQTANYLQGPYASLASGELQTQRP